MTSSPTGQLDIRTDPLPTCHVDRIESPLPPRWDERLRSRGTPCELLRLPAALFGAALWLRGAAYDTGLARAHDAGVAVLSVGNLSAGGTGKTPLCIWLARELAALGRRPGLASRGYKAGAQGSNDEARLFAAACPDVPHVEDPDRLRAARALAARGVDVVLLDDGFQHRRLARDQDWVLVDATRPWGLARDERGDSVRALLPRGLLRERPAALSRADVLVITRCGEVPPAWLAALEAELARMAPGKPLLLAAHRPTRLLDEHGVPRAFDVLADREVELVSGIGNPQAFERTARAAGLQVVRHHVWPDHHRYTAAEARELARQARERGRTLVVTRKDAVKLAPLGLSFLALEVELEFRRGQSIAHALLESLPRGADASG